MHSTFHCGREEFPENVRNSLRDKGVGSPGRIRTSNISVNSRGCETLNALFGVAYDRTTLSPDPQLGNFGQPIEEKKEVVLLLLGLDFCQPTRGRFGHGRFSSPPYTT